jgi:hypothetical protein
MWQLFGSLTVANLILVYQAHHCFCIHHCTVLALCLVFHTVFSHTNTVHSFSSQPHGSFQLHFSQTALPNFTITILCRLELQGCLGHNMSGWFYSFPKGMRARMVDKDCPGFESEVQAAGMWSPPNTWTQCDSIFEDPKYKKCIQNFSW